MFMPALTAVPLITAGSVRATRRDEPRAAAGPAASCRRSRSRGSRATNRASGTALLAPAGTPPEIARRCSTRRSPKIMRTADMKQRMADDGCVAVGSTREEFAKHLADEFAKWAKVIKASGAKAD